MNLPVFPAAADLMQMAKDSSETFGLDTKHFVAQLISFVIVALLLKRFAYGPILRVLEERRARIKESLANAEKIKAELAAAEAARQEILAKAATQANQIVEDARKAAERLLHEELQKASAVSEQIVTKAKAAAVLEHTRLQAELRRDVGRLVVKTAQQVTGKMLSAEDQERLIADTNRSLAA